MSSMNGGLLASFGLGTEAQRRKTLARTAGPCTGVLLVGMAMGAGVNYLFPLPLWAIALVVILPALQCFLLLAYLGAGAEADTRV